MFVVFDLDGTLADDAHRMHLIAGARRDYDAYYAACVDDKPRWSVVQSLKAHYLARHRVEIWTGRSEVVRAQTEDWLAARCGVQPTLLVRMRLQHDSRPGVVVKRGWLEEARANGGGPELSYDDRSSAVAMWRAEGVQCFQVAYRPD